MVRPHWGIFKNRKMPQWRLRPSHTEETFRKKERERRDKHIQVSKHEYQIYIVIARHHNRMVVDADVFPLFLDDHYGPSQAVTAEVKPTATTASWGRYRKEYKVPVGNIQGEFIC